ncbi:hypothetical protein E6P78_32330 [Streptomyces sp. A0958]|nr:hypothetical protein E6P78_32330 [Streptomyces sp. A0958]
MLATTSAGAVQNEPSPPASSLAPSVAPHPGAVPEDERDALLGQKWKSSQDVAWTTSSDANGFHLLTAAGSGGYAWKNLATLAEPGFDADSWIGNACVTGTGRYAVVVYAPRTFTNKPELTSILHGWRERVRLGGVPVMSSAGRGWAIA